jgi:GAF domain-containing protein
MKRFDIKTGILIPIFVDNDYWGFIVFTDGKNSRPAVEYEIDAFKYIAFNISVAIYSQRQHNNIKKLNEQLEQALQIAQKLIARNTKSLIRENNFLKEQCNLNKLCELD